MASEGDSDMCWICLEEAAENGSHQLMAPCKCPRKVHPQCLARWQLQQAGRHEEKFCRFCNNELADWKHHLTPEELKPEVSKVQPIMVVYFEGQIHRIPVKQGPDGLNEFTGKIRELFRLPDDVDISLTFGCKEPMSGTHLKLEGMGAFDAAVHCASVAAAERQQKIKKSYSTGNIGSMPALAGGADGAGSNGGGRAMGRSASNSSIPAAGLAATASASAAAATPSSAAGLSAAPASAQDRRRRFQDHQQQQHPGGSVRSRSFNVGSSAASGRGFGSAEPPAAFRNILSMLGGGGAGAATGTGGGSSGGGAGALGGGGSGGGGGGSYGTPFAEPAAQGASSGGGAGGSGASMRQAPVHHGSATAQQQQHQQHQLQRLKKERLSLRNISELTDVPELDETLAIGSLSGKFKLHFRAFSRKVARGLSFTSRGSGGSAGGSPAAQAGDALGAGSSASAAAARASSMPSALASSFTAPPSASAVTSRSLTSSPMPAFAPAVRS